MNVPTPASIKAQIDKKKVLESSEKPESNPSALSEKETVSPEPTSSLPKPRLAKREYVRPEHLTQRPFKDNEALIELKGKLPQEKKPLTRAQLQKKREKDRAYNVKIAKSLKEKGMSNVAIGKKMGMAESSIRGLLNPPTKKTPSKEKN